MGGGGVDDMVRDGVGRVVVSAIGGLVSFYDIFDCCMQKTTRIE